MALALAGGLGLLLAARDEATTEVASGPGMLVPAQDGRQSGVLRAGNVILVVGRGRVEETRALARRLAGGEATAALRAAGQAVVVQEGPGRGGIVAVAWRRQLRAERAEDPALEAFVEYWLGRGA